MSETRTLGRSGLEMPALGFGGAPLGNLFRPLAEADAAAAVGGALELGYRYFDTAPLYGYGLSERRLGLYLRPHPRDELIVSTKVGRTLFPRRGPAGDDIFVDAPPMDHRFDFTYDGVMRQFEDSLQRLGMDRVDLLVIHDIGLWHMGTQAEVDCHFADLEAGGLRALTELRADGRIRAIGAGANEMTVSDRFLALGELDFMLVALRYTLLDRSGRSLLDRAQQASVGIVIGAPFQSGILATGSRASSTYNYGAVPEDIREKVSALEAICSELGVSLRTAALRFPLTHPAVASVLAGTASKAEAESNWEAMQSSAPDSLWKRLSDVNP
jgi:D-threo-aldose 1-dehydrogenase